MRWVFTATIGAALLCGCMFHIRGPEVVLKPEGETVTVQTSGGTPLTGEFLGMHGDGLVLLREGRLVEVSLSPPNPVKVAGYSDVDVAEHDRLLLYARYPQGLSEERWAELLRQLGQDAFEKVKGAPPTGRPARESNPEP